MALQCEPRRRGPLNGGVVISRNAGDNATNEILPFAKLFDVYCSMRYPIRLGYYDAAVACNIQIQTD